MDKKAILKTRKTGDVGRIGIVVGKTWFDGHRNVPLFAKFVVGTWFEYTNGARTDYEGRTTQGAFPTRELAEAFFNEQTKKPKKITAKTKSLVAKLEAAAVDSHWANENGGQKYKDKCATKLKDARTALITHLRTK